MPDVIAIVLNYRRPDQTIRCVASLKKSMGDPIRILVVDNSPGDGSGAKIRNAHPDVEVHQSGRNEGYTGGMNSGMNRALAIGAEYFLLLNSDTEVEPEFVQKLVRALRSRPRAAAATGTIRYAGVTDRAWYAGGSQQTWRASAFTAHRYPGEKDIADGVVRSVTFISGCAFLVRSVVVRKLGPFDNRFFMYVEDAEFFSRLLSAGHELLYVPGAMIDHHAGDDSLTPTRLYYSVRNRLLFLEVSTRGATRVCGRAYLALTTLFKICWWSVSDTGHVRAAWAGFRDYLDGNFYAGAGPDLGRGGGTAIRTGHGETT